MHGAETAQASAGRAWSSTEEAPRPQQDRIRAQRGSSSPRNKAGLPSSRTPGRGRMLNGLREEVTLQRSVKEQIK